MGQNHFLVNSHPRWWRLFSRGKGGGDGYMNYQLSKEEKLLLQTGADKKVIIAACRFKIHWHRNFVSTKGKYHYRQYHYTHVSLCMQNFYPNLVMNENFFQCHCNLFSIVTEDILIYVSHIFSNDITFFVHYVNQ